MSIAQANLADLVGVFLGLTLTLCVFSYIFGDNVLFRLAIYIFIGVTAGYTSIVVWYNVIWPQLIRPLIFGPQSERLFVLFPLLFGGLLLLKISSRFSRFGNLSVAYLVGVGAAAAIGGAVVGTIFPQVSASANQFVLGTTTPEESIIGRLAQAGLILLGTVTSLIYFHFGASSARNRGGRRAEWIEWLAMIGQVFIAITLGALFAGVFSAALTAFIERLTFLINFVKSLF